MDRETQSRLKKEKAKQELLDRKRRSLAEKVPQWAFRPKRIIDEKLYMSRAENAVFDILLSHIWAESPEDAENLEYLIDTRKYIPFLGRKNVKDGFKMLREGSKNLCEHRIWFGDDLLGGCLNIVEKYFWREDVQAIAITLTPTFKKLIVAEKNEQKGMTQYPWRYSISLTGKYSARLYYCLKEWQGAGKRIDNVDTLRDLLDYPKSRAARNFRADINSAVEEINNTTDIYVSLKENTVPCRGGSKLVGFMFYIKRRDDTKPEIADSQALERMEEYETTIRQAAESKGFTFQDVEIQAIAKKALDGNLEQSCVKRRVIYELSHADYKDNLVGALVFAMSDKYNEPAAHLQMMTRTDDIDWDALEKQLLSS